MLGISSRRALVRFAGLSLITLFLAALGDLAYSVARTSSSLGIVELELERARVELRQGDVATGEHAVDAASDAADDAGTASSRPILNLLRKVPGAGADAEVLYALGQRSEDLVDVAAEALAAARALGMGKNGTGAIYRDGRVDFSVIDDARSRVAVMRHRLTSVDHTLQEVPSPLFPSLGDALERARQEVLDTLSSAKTADLLLTNLPDFLARGTEKRYLLLFQASGEARATGGVAGMFGVVSIANGRFDLEEAAPYTTLFPGGAPIRPVRAPSWFEAGYGDHLALRQWAQVNLSPNFPVVADVFLEMFEAARGESLDGVVAMDPMALSELLKATGPIRVNGFDRPISTSNARKTLLHDSYIDFSRRAQNEFLSRVIAGFWKELSQGDFESVPFIRALVRATRNQHLKIHSTEPDVAEALDAVHVNGDYSSFGDNVQMVFNNNYSLNKVDYFLRRTIDTEIRLLDDGRAIVDTSVTLQNTAPRGPPSDLLGRKTPPLAPGVNRMFMHMLLPVDSEVDGVFIDGTRVRPYRYDEDEYPVVWQLIRLDPEETRRFDATYIVPNAFEEAEGGYRFTYTVFPQATVNPDLVVVNIEAPPGFTIAEYAGAERHDDRTLRFKGLLDRPLVVYLDVVRD